MEAEPSTNANKSFNASQALELVSAYFDTEWPQTNVKDVQLRQITGGFVNRLHLITRSTAATQEPESVLIRHFGLGKNQNLYEEPRASNTSLSAAEQALIYYEMGRRGWGPKIYGLFPGGRLEEYVDAHPLAAAEACQPSIRKDLARSYARLHLLQLPLRKTFQSMVHELKEAGGTNKERTVSTLLKYGHPDSERLAVVLGDMDLQHEISWVGSLFAKHGCKPAIAVGDTNFLNVLVKNYDSECRTMLIDYETCTYSYRGVDIGGHFTERMYCWSHPENNLTGYPAPNVEEQRSFCESYLEEMKELGLKMTAEDSVDHLMLEAQIGRMWQILFSVTMGFLFGELPDEPVLHAGLAHMMETYLQLRAEWNGQM